MNKTIIILILTLILIIACEEIPPKTSEEEKECNSAEECAPCGNSCISSKVAVLADCAPTTEDFKCVCENNKCKKIEEAECISDNDCITGGCSGTICQSKNAPPVFTTCEYLPEYACYKEIDCKCINYRCQWDKTEEFNSCVEEARESGGEVIV